MSFTRTFYVNRDHNLYEGSRRDLFFNQRRRGAEEARCEKYRNFQAKGLLLDRTLESFIPKSTDGAIPKF